MMKSFDKSNRSELSYADFNVVGRDSSRNGFSLESDKRLTISE